MAALKWEASGAGEEEEEEAANQEEATSPFCRVSMKPLSVFNHHTQFQVQDPGLSHLLHVSKPDNTKDSCGVELRRKVQIVEPKYPTVLPARDFDPETDAAMCQAWLRPHPVPRARLGAGPRLQG
ncbi:hypothetical protein CRUP_030521 [Coryphaenoides rupestris]|nr:hypothetical protein CRUP_030521 [Coryphaenoides rupestris]